MESAYRDWEKHRGRSRGRHTATRRNTKVALGPRECRRLLQLGVCIILFFVVFIGKGVFPEQMATVRDSISGLISGDTDFRAAFANMGRSISNGEPVLDTLGELWVDVFGGGSVTVESWRPTAYYTAHAASLFEPAEYAAILAPGRTFEEPPQPETTSTDPVVQPEPTQAPDTPPEPTSSPEPSEPAVVHVEYTGPALPANATMDRYTLGLGQTMSPVADVSDWWVSSGYGWREHPVDGEEKFHNGVDLAINHGTGVHAFADGVVDYIGDSPIYGLYTQIRHDNGITSFYAHCSKLLVAQGQSVQVGDVIAQSGETGNATGPHLHFELKKDGVLLNPLYYIEDQ